MGMLGGNPDTVVGKDGIQRLGKDNLSCGIDFKDKCKKLILEMYRYVYSIKVSGTEGAMRGIQERYNQQLEDNRDFFNTDKRRWQTHQKEIKDLTKKLKKRIKQAENLGCKIPNEIRIWATIQPPSRPRRK